MSNLLVFDEYANGGRPLWRATGAQHSPLYFYGYRKWSDSDPLDTLYPEETGAAVGTYSKAWLVYDFGHGLLEEYAQYEPRTEDDLHWLCKITWRWRALTVIAPAEIAKECLAELIRIRWDEFRPLAYLTKNDPCEIAQVPWLCMLGLYSYHPTFTILGAKRPDLLDKVAAAGQGLEQFRVFPLAEAIGWEQKEWETHYRQIDPSEPHAPLSPEAEEAARQWSEFADEMARRAEAQRKGKQR